MENKGKARIPYEQKCLCGWMDDVDRVSIM